MSDINVQLQDDLNITQNSDEISVAMDTEINAESVADTIDITTADAQPINITLQEVLLRETETGASTFLELTDTPSTYAGQANKIVSVKTDGTGLEFTTASAGVTDHGALTGLADDDHTQYHNDTRGDARYYTQAQIATILADYLTSATASSTYYTEAEVDAIVAGFITAVTGDARYLQILNNLSDLNNTATARTNLGLIAGGAGDIWVEKAGDTMTGQLFIDGSANAIQQRVQAHSTQSANLVTYETSAGVVRAGVDSTGRLFGDPSNGTGNTVYGTSSYRDAATGTDNTIIGNNVGTSVTTGSRNTLVGQQVGQAINTGVENVLVGEAVGQNITGGGGNFGLGRSSLASVTVGNDNVAIGTEAMRLTSGDSNRNIAIGRNALGNSATVFNDAVGIGRFAGRANAATGNTYIGTQAGMNQGTGTNNVMIGYTAGQGSAAYNSSSNVFIGYQTGFSTTTGASNIFIGRSAGYRQTTNSNIFIVDNQNRASAAVEATDAILYGTMASAPATQTLALNAVVSITQGLGVTGNLGFFGTTPTTQQTELTDELTTVTYTTPGTPDYAIAAPIDSAGGSSFGFSTADEFNTAMSVIANLQTRVNELETKLVAYGLLQDAD